MAKKPLVIMAAGLAFKALLDDHFSEFQRVGVNLERLCKKAVSRGQKTIRVGDHMVGTNPSEPYTPPKVVTGKLRSLITHDVVRENGTVRVYLGVRRGEADGYAARLEFGFIGTDSLGRFVYQLPRPYLRSTLAKHGLREMVKAFS